MRVRDVMTTQIATVKSVAFLPEAAQLMLNEDVGMLPVIDGETLVGVITDRDIAVRGVAAGKDITQTPVTECLTTGDLVTVSPDMELRQAEMLMEVNKVRRLPVVEGGQLVGVLGIGDIAQRGSIGEVAEVLDHITTPGGDHSQST